MAKKGKRKAAPGDVATNRQAAFRYDLLERVEAGMQLQGSEVKSLREAKAVMSDAYATVKNNEAWLINLQVTEYPWANRWNHVPKRDRKLLLHRREIDKLDVASAQAGYTILPLEIYLKQGKIKVLLGVCKGKRQYDKRQDQKKKDATRDIEAALRRQR